MGSPCVLFIDCHEKKCGSIIQDLLNLENKNFVKKSSNGTTTYSWNLETKYYTSDINLCFLENLTKLEQTREYLKENIEGVLLSFDPEKEENFARVKIIYSSIHDDYPLKLLTCSSLRHKSHRHDVLEWCVSNQFELVELEVGDDDDEDEDDEEEDEIIKERKGIERVLEALKCNQWSNLILKEKPRTMARRSDDNDSDAHDNDDGGCNDNDTAKNTDGCESNSSNVPSSDNSKIDKNERGDSGRINNNNNNQATATSTTKSGEDSKKKSESKKAEKKPQSSGEEDELEQLFKNIPTFKEKASRLGFEERKEYAEKVVMKLWSAIGGDVAEVDDE